MTFKLSYRMFHILVQTICVVVAIGLACLCVHKYCLDDDLAEINFQTFNDQEHAAKGNRPDEGREQGDSMAAASLPEVWHWLSLLRTRTVTSLI